MQNVVGGIMLGCGILIAGLSGLCTIVVVGTSLADSGAGEFASMIPAALVFGGIPAAFGVGIFFLGRHLMRTAKKDDGPDDPSVTFQ